MRSLILPMVRALPAVLGLALTASPALAQDADVGDADPGDAVAQDDEGTDDDLDDILGGDDEEDSVKDETDALKRGDTDDRVGVQAENVVGEADAEAQKRLIKVVAPKTFLKLGRFEAVPQLGFVTNDPFLNRYIGGVSLGYHVTEIFAVEAQLAYSPDFQERDWKPITDQLVTKNNVSPDLSKLQLIANATFQFSPIYGKVALSGNKIINFDIYGAFGAGITQTHDDPEALQTDETDEVYMSTADQIHPTTNFGGGVRVVFNETVCFRVDGRSLVYIETINATTLEMKNNFILSAGVGFFFPKMSALNL